MNVQENRSILIKNLWTRFETDLINYSEVEKKLLHRWLGGNRKQWTRIYPWLNRVFWLLKEISFEINKNATNSYINPIIIDFIEWKGSGLIEISVQTKQTTVKKLNFNCKYSWSYLYVTLLLFFLMSCFLNKCNIISQP